MTNQERFERAWANWNTVDESSFYEADGNRIVQIVRERFGIVMTWTQAVEWWSSHSDDYAAQWLVLGSDDDVAYEFQRWLDRYSDQTGRNQPMITQIDHVCAQTPTTAQRRATLIADATVLANRTFGREAIAALPRQWHADDECAELRFTMDGQACWLAQDWVRWNTAWVVGCIDYSVDHPITVPPGAPVVVAAEWLREALAELRASMRDMHDVEV